MFRVHVDRMIEGAFASSQSAQECFDNAAWPKFPRPRPEGDYIMDDISPLFYRVIDEGGSKELNKYTESNESIVQGFRDNKNGNKNRLAWMGSKERREKLEVTPDDVITAEFGNGFVRVRSANLRLISTRTYLLLTSSLEAIIPYAGLRFSRTLLQTHKSAKILRWPACALQVQEPKDGRGVFRGAVRIKYMD